VKASLLGLVVGDALSMPVHWYYSPTKLRKEYGEVTGMMAPKPHHAESMVQGMSYSGTIDIMHDKARFYAGNRLADEAREKLATADIAARRDDHGNFVGAVEGERVHYHGTLKRGQNTTNACIARLLMRYLAKSNAGSQDLYDPDEFLHEHLYKYMTAVPDTSDTDQIICHNDTYMDVYLRGFFANASKGIALRNCAWSQRDQWSIGSLDGVVMIIPIIAAYSHEPKAFVVARAVEHHMLTHRSVTATSVVSVLAPLLLELYKGSVLREALDRAMDKKRPPRCTGREMRDSYVQHHGPGRIPKHEKWLQHMTTSDESAKEFVHRMASAFDNDEDVAGWGDRPNSRLATACYCEQTFTIVLYLAYKYWDDPKKALLVNANLGGHSTARGAVLGAIMGAAHRSENFPFVVEAIPV